jgi:general secretion pathway protein E
VLLNVKGKEYDLRVHVAPCVLGDSITVRVLDREAVPLDLHKCGHSQVVLDALTKLAKTPHGLFVLCGPTGCGNTTTLYSLLKQIAARGVEKVTTAEDPVEFIIDGVEQMQIRPEAGLTFASAVRSMLRSDPDVLMAGEIRDREAAIVLHQAAMTGHLVFTTLHTNFAAEVPGRLIDIGVPPFVVGSCLIGAMAQRLVRRLCPQTRQPDPDAHDKLRALRADEKWFAQTFYGPAGSETDAASGYHGRVPINDLLLVDADTRKMIAAEPTSQDLTRALRDKGVLTLMDDGLAKAAAGLTSLDELLRVGLARDWFA